MIKKEKGDKNISQRENTKVSALATAPLRHSSVSFKTGRCLESLTKLRQIFVELLCTRALRLLLLPAPQRERSLSLSHTLNLDINPTLSCALHVFLSLYDTSRKVSPVVFHMLVFIFIKKFVYLLKFEKENLCTFLPDLF